MDSVDVHPGKRPVSNTPRKKRVVMRPPQLETRPWQIITTPKANMHSDTVVALAISKQGDEENGAYARCAA